MSTERLMTILIGPHMSEKSTRVGEKDNQVVFRVRNDSTKAEIRDAIKLMFEVEVDRVTVVNQKGKEKRHGKTTGRRSDWKKAYVSLSEGHSIDFLGAE